MHSHRAHDYIFLIRRWRSVARIARLKLQHLDTSSSVPTFFLRSKALQPTGGIYLSAAIHGDEPAASEGLIRWAEHNVHRLASLPLLLLPCLNPWGLINNCRFDANGTDLNRAFHLDTVPVISALKELINPYQFRLALTLHEDFDAQGLYLYELHSRQPFWGESLVDTARPLIPIEGRSTVDGHRARCGLIRRRFRAGVFEQIGYPEAIWLHLHHAQRSFTLETPSEFALEQRISAHVAIIEECVRKALLEDWVP